MVWKILEFDMRMRFAFHSLAMTVFEQYLNAINLSNKASVSEKQNKTIFEYYEFQKKTLLSQLASSKLFSTRITD